MSYKPIIKYLLYYSHLFQLYHKIGNSNTLTIVMFHRILPDDKAEQFGADPVWTIAPTVFHECLRFFLRYYNIISLNKLAEYVDSTVSLPHNALLISFDDGWRDTYTYGLPILKDFGCPAVIFVASDSVDRKEPFWQEQIFASWRKGFLQDSSIDQWLFDLKKAHTTGSLSAEQKARHLIQSLSELEPVEAIHRLRRHANRIEWPERQMLSADELAELAQNQIDIGLHGLTHRPFTALSAEGLSSELRGAARELAAKLHQDQNGLTSLSFPHGSYSRMAVSTARQAGYRLLFSSDSIINPLLKGDERDRIWGRIAIHSHDVCGSDGVLSKVKMARHIMTQPKRTIAMENDFS